MKTYYFVGGPTDGHADAFRRRLLAIGGTPPGWQVYPHANGDGQALHIVRTQDKASILAHLAHFRSIYARGRIVEVVPVSAPDVPA